MVFLVCLLSVCLMITFKIDFAAGNSEPAKVLLTCTFFLEAEFPHGFGSGPDLVPRSIRVSPTQQHLYFSS